MLKYMKKIVYEESRPFHMKEFLDFDVDGEHYTQKYGTIKNKFSKFRKERKIELYYRSHLSFYTLAGVTFGNNKSMTSDPTYLSNNKYNHDLYLQNKKIQKHPMYKILEYIQFGNRAIHDLHLTFEAKGLWNFLSGIEHFRRRINSKNQSISFGYFEIETLKVQIITQRSDTVTIIVGCSSNPIMLDPAGIFRLTEVLTRVEERLGAILNNPSNKTFNKEYNQSYVKIPNKDEWNIVLWHLGRDSVSQYSGKHFECSWNVAKNLFIRVYSKELKLKTIVRMEVQENPDMALKQLLIQFIKKEDKTRLIEVLA